ncbi:transposase [Pseudomonas sp. IT-P2]
MLRLSWRAAVSVGKLSFRDMTPVRGLGGRNDWCMMQGKAPIENTYAGRATAPGKQSHAAHAGDRHAFPRGRCPGADYS